MKKYYLAIFIIFLLSIGVVVGNYFMTKGIEADKQRTEDIQAIESAMDPYVSAQKKLPTSLSQLQLGSAAKNRLSQYEYKPGVLSGDGYTIDYQVCTVYETQNSRQSRATYMFDDNSTYDHPKGRHCHSLSVSAPLR